MHTFAPPPSFKWHKKWLPPPHTKKTSEAMKTAEKGIDMKNWTHMKCAYFLSLFLILSFGLFLLGIPGWCTTHSSQYVFIHHSNAKHAHKNVYVTEVTVSKWQSMKNEKWSLQAKPPIVFRILYVSRKNTYTLKCSTVPQWE